MGGGTVTVPAFFAIAGRKTGDLVTFMGQVIVHEDRAEMAYLFPNDRIVPHTPTGHDVVMMLVDHPDMSAVRFPLNRKDFNRG